LTAFFDKEDGEGVIDVLEVGPFVNPQIGVGVLWELSRKAEPINLFWGSSVSVCDWKESKRT
jgi:hypothetical protein